MAMSKYDLQLAGECRNNNCMKIFCRRHYCSETSAEIARILAQYGNLFHCENTEELLLTGEVPNIHPPIDLFFYVNSLFYGVGQGHSRAQSCPKLEAGKSLKRQKRAGKTRPSTGGGSLKPASELEHKYCALVNDSPNIQDSYFITGIIHLLLTKFQKSPNFNIALVIIRIFMAVSKTSSLGIHYYKLLKDVYTLVYERISSSTARPTAVEHDSCPAGACLFYVQFSNHDFKCSMNAICSALNASIITNIRESAKMHSLLEILQILYQINKVVEFVPYEAFYLKDFCNKMNLPTECKFLRTNQPTALQYSFILPVGIKAEILKIENCEAMKGYLQDAFFRALFEGVTEPYLFLSIRRAYIYHDTLEALRGLEKEELKKQLKIKFVDEEGVDSGGIRKEYFQMLSQAISSDKELFVFKNNRIWFRMGADKTVLRTIGKILGMALYNDVVLNIPFPFIFFKKILAVPLAFNDLAEIEPDHYRSIQNLEHCTKEELQNTDLFFAVERTVDGQGRVEELIPGGINIPVRKDNFRMFKQAYAEFYTTRAVEEEFEALLSGFHMAINPASISMLLPEELEKIVIGLNEYDFKVIQRVAVYSGYTADSQTVRDLWSIVDSYSLSYKKKFLQFITGNDRLPVAGSAALKLTIVKNGCDTERLPSSQTCFNTLLLPEYSSKEKLANKLGKAIKLTAGFFLI